MTTRYEQVFNEMKPKVVISTHDGVITGALGRYIKYQCNVIDELSEDGVRHFCAERAAIVATWPTMDHKFDSIDRATILADLGLS